ncbi:hypothetical protein ACEQPO_07630 [Bacillus sp. SL00103]
MQTLYKDGYIIERGPDSFLERKVSGPRTRERCRSVRSAR